MGYRAMFAVGFAVGFVVGTRAGRERYDQMVKYAKQVADSPAVHKATVTIKEKTTEISKTAVSRAPDVAKSASAQVPKIAKSARQKAGKGSPRHGKDGAADDVSADGHLVYPADDPQSSVNGTRYNT
ncbi:MAG TPA: hypothetical protein VNV62_27725 [Trebonia sp.]|jgi:hypothetical protein|nr:hypothetical protein [Trebonia sp.]